MEQMSMSSSEVGDSLQEPMLTASSNPGESQQEPMSTSSSNPGESHQERMSMSSTEPREMREPQQEQLSSAQNSVAPVREELVSQQPPPQVLNFSPQSLKNEIESQKGNAKSRIETLVLGFIDSIMQNQFPMIERPRLIANSKDKVRVTSNPNLSTKIIFGGRSSKTFAMQMYVMSLVYKMIQQEQTSTTRDLFYESLNFFGNQNRLCVALKQLSLLLKVPREALCIEASAKGLLAGSISFENANGEIISAANSRHGIIVPNKLHELTIITDARCILFVEKDATFQRLLEEKILEVLGPIILITGKGYPDMQTRRLMCILNRIHRLKVYALVDCDPYGIEIAAVVKWGSYRNGNVGGDENFFLTSDLSVPDLVWLGLLPSEVTQLSLALNASSPLTEKDRKKLVSVAERIKLQDDQSWLPEVYHLQELGQKTELEALFSSPMFTTKVYLRSKLKPIVNAPESEPLNYSTHTSQSLSL